MTWKKPSSSSFLKGGTPLSLNWLWTQFKKVQWWVERQFKLSFCQMNWTWIGHWVHEKNWIELRTSIQFWTAIQLCLSMIPGNVLRLPFQYNNAQTYLLLPEFGIHQILESCAKYLSLGNNVLKNWPRQAFPGNAICRTCPLTFKKPDYRRQVFLPCSCQSQLQSCHLFPWKQFLLVSLLKN